MRILSRIRGPRLGTKLLLLGLPLTLLFVPWASYLLLDEMAQLSVQMQSNQQRLIAESISISFNGRDDLFADLPVNLSEYEALVARPIQSQRRLRLDGSASDWDAQALQPMRFGPEGGDGSFALSLGTRGSTLYAYLEIIDETRVYRNPEVLRLDNADQVRIGFIRPDGEDGRITVTLSASGDTIAYRMDEDWRFAKAGPPENSVQGLVREIPTGYAVELGIPFSLLGARRFFGLTFVDVDDPQTRAIRAVTHTLPTSQEKKGFNLVAFRSPDLLNILEGLGYSSMRVLVIDPQRRIRAEAGSYRTSAGSASEPSWQARTLGYVTAVHGALAAAQAAIWQWFADQPDTSATPQDTDEMVMATALAGESIALRRRVGKVETIMAGHPIVSQGAVIGMVAVEQNIDDILFFQREAINQIVLVSLLSFLVALLCLVVFAGRLTWRIRNLRREAAIAIDEYGRLRTNSLDSGMTTADEIGDLARGISNMLARLDQYHTFLRGMPRTLRHEINNSLNTLNTSLEHLAQEAEQIRDSKYLESAKRGVLRIGTIVQNLADAANLEESLASEDLEVIDVQVLLESYINNCRTIHKGQSFIFRGVPHPVYAAVADYRIEQLLDKLIDNALDFHRTGSPIKVQIDVYRKNLRIVVANRGPMLPAPTIGSLFESMVSRRPLESKLHFGLGLYVVRVIAEQHGGSVQALNLADGSGVAIIVWLPLADPEIAHPAAAPDAMAAG